MSPKFVNQKVCLATLEDYENLINTYLNVQLSIKFKPEHTDWQDAGILS
jgi:hypothetical protein